MKKSLIYFLFNLMLLIVFSACQISLSIPEDSTERYFSTIVEPDTSAIPDVTSEFEITKEVEVTTSYEAATEQDSVSIPEITTQPDVTTELDVTTSHEITTEPASTMDSDDTMVPSDTTDSHITEPPSPYQYTKNSWQHHTTWSTNIFSEPFWRYFYTPQTQIIDKIDVDQIMPSVYDSNKKTWIPQNITADMSSWQQLNNNYSATLAPITGYSAILAFVAPEDGCYTFEIGYGAGTRPNNTGDGVNILLFANDTLLYSLTIENDFRMGEDPVVVASLQKGQCMYFVVDPRSNGTGDLCNDIRFHIVHEIDVYINNKTTWAFGTIFNNNGNRQGQDGWYAGSINKNDPLFPSSIIEDTVPNWLQQGYVFGGISGEPSNYLRSKRERIRAPVISTG